MTDRIWVAIDEHLRATRIFKTFRDAALSNAPYTGLPKELRPRAVEQIRLAVFKRDGYACTHCGTPVTWKTGHMHERHHRGKGGEVSIDNGTTLCYSCHLNNPIAGHGKRKPQWRQQGCDSLRDT